MNDHASISDDQLSILNIASSHQHSGQNEQLLLLRKARRLYSITISNLSYVIIYTYTQNKLKGSWK